MLRCAALLVVFFVLSQSFAMCQPSVVDAPLCSLDATALDTLPAWDAAKPRKVYTLMTYAYEVDLLHIRALELRGRPQRIASRGAIRIAYRGSEFARRRR